MNKTTEMSFRLKPSLIPDGGVGVFAIHDIAKDTWLDIKPPERIARDMKKEEIPEELIHLCIENEDGTYACPPEFNHPHLVWYLNHSDNPNAELREGGYFATMPIKADEEILIDYNLFHEPGSGKISFGAGS